MLVVPFRGSLLRRGYLCEIEYWVWKARGGRGAFPALFRFSLSPASELPTYGQGSTKEASEEERD